MALHLRIIVSLLPKSFWLCLRLSANQTRWQGLHLTAQSAVMHGLRVSITSACH